MSDHAAATDWKASLQSAVDALGNALKDAATLSVETRTFKLGDPAAENEAYKGKLVARTVIEVDGDTLAGVPVTDEAAGAISKELLDIHNQNVDRAMKYRMDLINSAQQLIKDLLETIKAS